MRLAKECRGNGSADACGAMALNRTALSEPPPSTPWFARSRWFKSSITSRWNKGPVSASRHNRPSGSSVTGPIEGRTVLVQGGAGAVGACAVQLAHRAGAGVIATCRSEGDKEIASRAGADEVLLTTGNLAERVRGLAPDGVNHIVEVAFGANIKTDTTVL